MKNDKRQDEKKQYSSNKDGQGVDKPPEKERNKAEKITRNDLKNKKVDADPGEENKVKPSGSD